MSLFSGWNRHRLRQIMLATRGHILDSGHLWKPAWSLRWVKVLILQSIVLLWRVRRGDIDWCHQFSLIFGMIIGNGHCEFQVIVNTTNVIIRTYHWLVIFVLGLGMSINTLSVNVAVSHWKRIWKICFIIDASLLKISL